jgi:cytochrome P450
MKIDSNVSVLDPRINTDPFPYFNMLRENDPVHWNERHRAWLVTRFDDVRVGLRDPRLSVDRIRPYIQRRLSDEERERFGSAFTLMESFLPFRDPPDHTRLRRIVQHGFAPKIVKRQSEGIDAVTQQLAERVTAKLRRGEQVDLVTELARPLPATVMARIVHLDAVDSHLIEEWTQNLALFMGGAVNDPDRNEKVYRGVTSMSEHIRAVLDSYDGESDDDVIGALLAAEADGDRLSRDEIVATCILLTFAGYRTTACSATNAIHQLLRRPDLYDALAADHDRIPAAVEEFMRYEGHARIVIRWAKEDFELQGKQIRAGQRVFLVLAAANRDPRQFERPDEIDIAREPNPHLGFGTGIHFCLGAPLARIEIQSIVRSFVSVLPRVEAAEGHRHWEDLLTNRALARLPVVLQREKIAV